MEDGSIRCMPRGVGGREEVDGELVAVPLVDLVLLVGRAFLTFFLVPFRFDFAVATRVEDALVVAGCAVSSDQVTVGALVVEGEVAVEGAGGVEGGVARAAR